MMRVISSSVPEPKVKLYAEVVLVADDLLAKKRRTERRDRTDSADLVLDRLRGVVAVPNAVGDLWRTVPTHIGFGRSSVAVGT
jgi:hypothetical protein